MLKMASKHLRNDRIRLDFGEAQGGDESLRETGSFRVARLATTCEAES